MGLLDAKTANLWGEKTINSTYNEYDGFQNIDKNFGVRKFSTTMEVSEDLLRQSGRELKLEIQANLARELAYQIVKEGFLETWKLPPDIKNDPFGGTTKFEASISIVDKHTSNVIVPVNAMIWQGKEWSEVELIKALEIANPEYMI